MISVLDSRVQITLLLLTNATKTPELVVRPSVPGRLRSRSDVPEPLSP